MSIFYFTLWTFYNILLKHKKGSNIIYLQDKHCYLLYLCVCVCNYLIPSWQFIFLLYSHYTAVF